MHVNICVLNKKFNTCERYVYIIILLCYVIFKVCTVGFVYSQYGLVCCRFSELTEPHIQILQTVAPRLSLSSLTSLAEVIVARIISCEKEDVMAANGRDRYWGIVLT